MKPSTTIKISFWLEDESRRVPSPVSGYRRHIERRSDYRSDDVRNYANSEWKPREYVEEVTIDVGDPAVSIDMPDEESESESSESDAMLSTSDHDEELVNDAEIQRPPREVLPLVDAEGNKFSFSIDTSKAILRPQIQQKIEGTENVSRSPAERQDTSEGSVEKYRITKAILGGTDARAVVQIHTLPGPVNTKLGDGIKTRWYHVQAEQLRLSRIKEICLGLPNLSLRLQLLTREVLAQVEKHKVKAFVDGFFVEPGTVLRAVEKCQPDPQAVIFSCIPYLELQQSPRRPLPKKSERLFPPRTLMQAMYPYEPVRDRDSEQAYKKLGDSQNENLVYVPNLWMLNIGTEIVVTCGHKPLADEMIKSIEVVHEDLTQLSTIDMANSLTSVRVVDRDSLVHLYSLESCRSYFQMEEKLAKLRALSREVQDPDGLALTWTSPEGKRAVTPGRWSAIISRTDLIFIELEVVEQEVTTPAAADLNMDEVTWARSSVPPFFHWPSAATKAPVAEMMEHQDIISGATHETKCLEYAEKSMLNDTLDTYSTINAVDKTFASTMYYKSLPEDTYGHVDTQFKSLNSRKSPAIDRSVHASVIASQSSNIVVMSDSFCKIVQATLRLFVSDTDKSSILRKVWSAVGNIHNYAADVQLRGFVQPESTQSFEDIGTRRRDAQNDSWVIRRDDEGSLLLPGADKKLKRAVRHCRQCSGAPFPDAETAIDHLRTHLDRFSSSNTNRSSANEASVSLGSAEAPNLNDWIVQEKQLDLEKFNAGGLKILTQASNDAMELFKRIKELADGVRNEDGKMSDLYTFPRQLLEAFRKLLVFYLAVERALYHTEGAYQELGTRNRIDDDDLPYSDQGIGVLKRFARGVENSVLLARHELCSMVKSETSLDSMQDLALGPEYMCGWLMRRLLVKPLEKRMSIGDMYREYLSTIVSPKLPREPDRF